MRDYRALDPDFTGGMPHYLFEVDGEPLELPFESMADAPELGESLRLPDGRVATRLMHPNSRAASARVIDTRFASKSLPLWYPYHKGEFNKRGEALFASRNELDETVARANHHGEELVYDHPR